MGKQTPKEKAWLEAEYKRAVEVKEFLEAEIKLLEAALEFKSFSPENARLLDETNRLVYKARNFNQLLGIREEK